MPRAASKKADDVAAPLFEATQSFASSGLSRTRWTTFRAAWCRRGFLCAPTIRSCRPTPQWFIAARADLHRASTPASGSRCHGRRREVRRPHPAAA